MNDESGEQRLSGSLQSLEEAVSKTLNDLGETSDDTDPESVRELIKHWPEIDSHFKKTYGLMRSIAYNAGVFMPEKLTERQLDILGNVAKGYVYKENAEKMGVGESIIKRELRKIKNKLGVRDYIEAAVWWTTNYGLDRAIQDEMADDAKESIQRLTERQLDILEYLGNGDLNKEIARKLDVSMPTVRRYINKTCTELGIPVDGSTLKACIELIVLYNNYIARIKTTR